MAKKLAATQASPPEPVSDPPRIHAATLGSQGRVIRGPEITETEAADERQAGRDIVVCGDDQKANRRRANRVEKAVGPCKRQDPHRSAGPYALPHFQQETPPPEGHSFYETTHRKAAKNP